MSQFKIIPNHAGVSQLLKSESLQQALLSLAQHVGDDAKIYINRNRAVADASGSNKDNAMLKRLK